MWIARTCGNWLDIPGKRPKPIPFLTGIKFQDDNRDGTRQAGEVTLQGWQFRVTRIASDVGQPTGMVGTVTTNAAGRFRFDFDGHGPGTYRVEEVVQDGWKECTSDNSHDVEVEFGGGNRRYNVADFGNARTSADVAKTSFEAVDPPERLDVRTPT